MTGRDNVEARGLGKAGEEIALGPGTIFSCEGTESTHYWSKQKIHAWTSQTASPSRPDGEGASRSDLRDDQRT